MNSNVKNVFSIFPIILVLFSFFSVMAYAAPFAYIENYSDNNVSVIDTATNAVVGNPITVGTNPSTIAVHPAGTFVYVANYSSNNISVISTATNTVVSTVIVGTNPRGVAIHSAGTYVYVSNFGSNNVSVIDTFDNTVVKTIPVGTAPRGIAVNPTGTRVYVANTGSKNVSVINTDTNTVVSSVTVKSYPNGVAVNTSGTRVYVSNYSSNNVSVIDTNTNTVIGSPIAVGTNPVGVAVNHTDTLVYVANYNSKNVSVIDTATNTVVTTITVENLPDGVALNPSGTSLYVTNNGSKSVSVIDTLSNTVVKTITVGSGPTSMGKFIGPEAINGACGGDNLQTLSTQPGNLCTAGAPTSVTSGTNSYTWNCLGNGVGTTTNCSATRLFAVSASVGNGNGIISPSQYVTYNATPSFVVTPNSGYLAGPVTGTCGGALAGNSYTTTGVTADCTVVATFTPGSTTTNAFSFNPQTGIALNSVVTSNSITVAGMTAAAAPIAIAGGAYSINGGAYSAVAGSVKNGDTVAIQQISSGSAGMMTTATLTISAIAGDFWVTTSAAGCLLNPVWISGSTSYYTLIQSAYDHAGNDDVLDVNALSFGEDLLLSGDKRVTLKGGFDCAYATNAGQFTTISSLTVGGAGSATEGVIVENLIISGSGSGIVLTSSSSGMLTLPPGAAILPNALVVSSAIGDVAVRPDGSFRVVEPAGSGLATITATDSNGKLVMLGHVDRDHPELNGISPTTTAEELLFLSTMSFILPREQWPRVYELLAAAPETATLAAVIAARIAVNPTAVADQDPAIMAAINSATSSLLTATASSSKTQAAPLAAKVPIAGQVSAPADGGLNTVSVNIPTPNPYGLFLQASLDDLGIYIQNTLRIHRHYFVYRTGYIPATGNFTDPPTLLDNWLPVSDGFLPAVTGATGVISSFVDFFAGNKIAWAPKVTDTIPIPVVPLDAKGSSFKVYVVGAGFAGPRDANGVPIPPAELNNQPDLLATVTNAAYDMALLEAVKEIILPFLTKLLPFALKLDDPNFSLTFAHQLAGELTTLGFNMDIYVKKGDFKGIWSEFIKFFTSNKQAKDGVFKLLYQWLASQEVVASGGAFGPSGWVKNVDNVCVLLKNFDIAMVAADEYSIWKHINNSNTYNSWDATSISVTVKLKPKVVTISPSMPHVDFTVRAMGVPGTSLPVQYRWYGPDKGTFDDHNGQIGNSIYTYQSIVTYNATPAVPTSGTDTIYVDVFDRHNILIKTVSASVKFTDNPFLGDWYAIWPNDSTVDANQPVWFSCYYDDGLEDGVFTFYCDGNIFRDFINSYASNYSISGTTFTTAPVSFYGDPWQMTGELQSDGSLFLSFPGCLKPNFQGWDDPVPSGKPCSSTFTRDRNW